MVTWIFQHYVIDLMLIRIPALFTKVSSFFDDLPLSKN